MIYKVHNGLRCQVLKTLVGASFNLHQLEVILHGEYKLYGLRTLHRFNIDNGSHALFCCLLNLGLRCF